MKTIEVVKLGVGMVVSLGAGVIVGNIIKGSTPSTTTKIMKLVIGAGGLVLSSMAGDAAATYVDKNIDLAVETFNETIQELQQQDLMAEKEDEEAEEA